MTIETYRMTVGGWQSLLDGHVVGVTPPTPTGTIFGMNVGDGNNRTDLATRIVDFGDVPACRAPYYGDLPATWDTTLATKRCPRKRFQVSFAPAPSAILNGSYDTKLRNWATSVPADHEVGLCYWSEPNDEIKAGTLDGIAWRDANYYVSEFLGGLSSAARVFPSPIVSAPKFYADGVFFEERWMLDFAAMNNPRAVFNWDNYGNPHGGTGLDGAYPAVADVQDRAYGILGAHGWLNSPGHWGITEFNAPQRTFDTDESIRAAWITDYVNLSIGRAVPPRQMFLWTGTNGNWDQDFHTSLTRDAYAAFVATSA